MKRAIAALAMTGLLGAGCDNDQDKANAPQVGAQPLTDQKAENKKLSDEVASLRKQLANATSATQPPPSPVNPPATTTDTSINSAEKSLSPDRLKTLSILKARFYNQPELHPDMAWSRVERYLTESPDFLDILKRLEDTGGEPDAVTSHFDSSENSEDYERILFVETAVETPSGKGRRNINQMEAEDMAESFGAFLLSKEGYDIIRNRVDAKTQSWLADKDEEPTIKFIGSRRGNTKANISTRKPHLGFRCGLVVLSPRLNSWRGW